MSIRLMSAIWDSETVTDPTDLLVLLALADFANDDGVCWPAVGRIARRARISERQARRIITRLIEAGLVTAGERKGGRNTTTTYRVIAPRNPDTDVHVSPRNPDIHDRKPGHPRPKTRTSTTENPDIAMSADPPIDPPINHQENHQSGGVGGETALNGGGEGGNSPAADERPAAEPTNAGAELPAEVIAAWRWPLTAQARAFLRNAIRDYTAGEVLTALEIAASQPREIERPAAYIKRVLQRRLSDLVDDAERRAPVSRPIPPDDAGDLPDPPPAPTRPPRDVALVQTALAEAVPAKENSIAGWPIRIDGDTVTVNARHEAQWLSRAHTRMEEATSAYLGRPITLSIVNI